MNTSFYKKILWPFFDAVYRFPNKNAFCINEKFYTYKQFEEYISKIRIAIQICNDNSTKVGLVVNDDIETYASIFALWLEKKCYIPLHPNHPIDRCLDTVEQVNISLVLDSSRVTRYSEVTVLTTSSLEYKRDCFEYEDIYPDNELAYILFTSGSTGKPKGVMITRENVAAFMDSFWETGIKIMEDDRCLQCFDLTFDVSVQGYLVALTKGACCYTIPHGQIKYVYCSGLIDDHKLTFGAMAPSILRYMKPYFDQIDATSLKTCILTAEACPLSLMEDWHNHAINTELYDFYGPTEATIYCTYYKLNNGGENKTLNGIISIGAPMKNVTAIIIDNNQNTVPIGEKGELCIAGAQISIGYWNNPELNQKSFFEKEINGKILRFYHTGDLCCQNIDGNIMYSGRLDQQAKIQGFRVELSEIEFHAREFLKDRNVVVIAFENKANLKEIYMFIESELFDTEDLLKYMRSKMPDYMIPNKFYFEPNFPLNANYKIDNNKLIKMIK
jgi:D-alanine--poly(phosphoribitol) ligase subunit 1